MRNISDIIEEEIEKQQAEFQVALAQPNMLLYKLLSEESEDEIELS